MSTLDAVGSNLGTALTGLLLADDIVPGMQPSYQICKDIYLFHPLGKKIAEKPLEIMQSQERQITVAEGAPEDRVADEFKKKWKAINADKHIFNCMSQKRVYGISSLAVQTEGEDPSKPLLLKDIAKKKIAIKIFDPLNTAGSLVLNQDPLAMDFQHAQEIRVNNQTFHRSRTRVVMNESPIYISFTTSSFGFVGRSVYQRSLFPLKSFVQTMVTNDMVSVKAGTLVAKIKQASTTVSNAMQYMFGLKRDVVREAQVGRVISISTDGEEIESIDLKNLSEPFKSARQFIIEDISSGVPMPSKMLTQESFAVGFADGTEDAKEQARYIGMIRAEAAPLYDFMDEIVMHLAWTPEFFADQQERFPEEYRGLTYEAAFFKWKNSFNAIWPNLLEEPDSEKVTVADVKLKALIAILQVLMPRLDPENLAITVQWVADNANEMKELFSSPLTLNYESLEDYDPSTNLEEPATPRPFSAADSAERAIADLQRAGEALRTMKENKRLRLVAKQEAA